MTNLDWAAAEISARTAEIKAKYPHLTQPGSLAAELAEGLAAIRAQAVADATDAIAPLPDLDPASIPADAREALKDAEENAERAGNLYDEAAEELEAARRGLEDARDRLAAAEDDHQRHLLASDFAQDRLAGTLRAYGMVRTATGYARRRI